MGNVREEGAAECLKKKKKQKKRKFSDFGILGGVDDGNMQLEEGCHRKKTKIEGLGGNGVSEVVLDLDADVSEDKKSRKEKKKKEKSIMKGEVRNNCENLERKARKSGSGDEGGTLNSIEASRVMSGQEIDGRSVNDNESGGVMNSEVMVVTEEVKLMNDKNEKKKKSKLEPKSSEAANSSSSDVVGHVGCVEKQIVDKGTEKVDLVKNKKRKEKVHGVNEHKEPTKDKRTKKKDTTIENTDNGEHAERQKNKKKKKEKGSGASISDKDVSSKGFVSSENKERREAVERAGLGEGQINNKTAEEVKHNKKKKEVEFGAGSLDKELANNIHVASVSDGDGSWDGASKKGKKKSLAVNTEANADAGGLVTNEGNEPTEPSEKSSLSKKSRKVKFADSVEVFPLPDNSSEVEENLAGGSQSSKEKKRLGGDNKKKKSDDGLVQGKRFSIEEDEIIKNAVLQYIEDHHLGEEGVKMVMKCRLHRDKFKDCWKEIAEALPWRHRDAVYSRAHILFERSENRKWTKEELEEVRKYHEKYGPRWRELADEIGRNRIHVKDAFRQVKLANKKTGPWSQDEYQTLFNLVNKDLRIRAFMERKSKHGMLRDNIGWEAISEQLSTRTDPICCQKWYNQLTSALVVSGKWADADDYRLLMALVDLDATCEEDVDWDNVLEHRSGDVCRKRWNEMVRHIGEHGTKSFCEQVEILSQRYCPDVLEAREAYDSKPFVD